MIQRPIFSDSGLQEQFMQKGYVKVAMRNPGQLHELAQEINALQPDDRFDPNANKVNPLSTLQLHCTFLDTNAVYKQKVQELISRYFEPEIRHFLIDYSFMTANVFQKPPGTGKMHFHQNWFLAERAHTCLTFWVPLHDVDENNGALQVVEGSHKISPDIPTPMQPDYFTSFEQELPNHLTTIPLKFGEAVFFCESLIHGSPVNNSDKPRTAIQSGLYPSEVSPALFLLDREADCFELYPIDSSFFVDHSIEGILSPLPGKTPVKTFPNPNKAMGYQEFLSRMAQGPHFRAALYAGKEVDYSLPTAELSVEEPASPAPVANARKASRWSRFLSRLNGAG